MNIHEYQAKDLLAKAGIAVPAGYPALSVEEAVAAAKQLPGPLWVVKSQIHAGSSLNLPLPRPPAWICDLTTHSGPGSFFAAATASSTLSAG